MWHSRALWLIGYADTVIRAVYMEKECILCLNLRQTMVSALLEPPENASLQLLWAYKSGHIFKKDWKNCKKSARRLWQIVLFMSTNEFLVDPFCCEWSLCLTTTLSYCHDDSNNNWRAKRRILFTEVKLEVCNVVIGMWWIDHSRWSCIHMGMQDPGRAVHF